MQKDTDTRLQEEFDRFVEFGRLLDRPTRKYLLQYLQNQLEPGRYVVPEINDLYFQYFQRALEEIFAVRDLLQLCRRNERITQQIILDTLYWLRKTYEKVRARNPYQEEVDYLGNWAITPLHVFAGRWHILITWLQTHYQKEDLDLDFYHDRFRELIGQRQFTDIPAADRERLELILTDLLAQWDARLHAKILEYQLTHLDAERESYLQLLEAKVSEYTRLTRLISPFTDYLGWDLSRELWQETSFDLLQHYNELLRDEASLQELADLLGRLREAEIEIEEETMERTIIRQEWVTDDQSRAEITGIQESDDLNRLLSSEAGLLATEDTEWLFLKKFADRQLLTFRYEDRRLAPSHDQTTEVFQRVRQREKGPFIVCVDTSESMTGRPEQIAKVLTLGILKMAIRENRRAFLINFSIGIKTLDLHDIANSLDELARFLRMSFYGGTDISLPLYEALRQLRTNDYQDADVLVISDFIMHRVNKDALDEVRHFRQNRNTQFHSLTLSDEPNAFILEHFDTNWQYDPKQKGVIRELARELRPLWNRP